MQQDRRRYKARIISIGPKNHKSWFKEMLGDIITVKLIRYKGWGCVPIVVTEDYKYIRMKYIEILHEYEADNRKYPDHNEPTCSHFGCAKKLSLRQQMAGGRCEDHSNMPKFNIMLHIGRI